MEAFPGKAEFGGTADPAIDRSHATRRFSSHSVVSDMAMSANILEIIAQATAEKHVSINLRLGFVNDTHFCVWAYVVDLDQNTFEVFGDSETKKPPPQSLTILDSPITMVDCTSTTVSVSVRDNGNNLLRVARDPKDLPDQSPLSSSCAGQNQQERTEPAVLPEAISNMTTNFFVSK
ncbi:hypothetical protein V8E54_004779 [Elaphomyces granulatus]